MKNISYFTISLIVLPLVSAVAYAVMWSNNVEIPAWHAAAWCFGIALHEFNNWRKTP